MTEQPPERLLLTDAERRRFVAWLRGEALQHDSLAKQMDTLPQMAVGARRERQMALAKTLVADDLESWEPMSIGGSDG